MASPPIRILLANEPRAYREAMATAFRELRPHLEILTLHPGDLDHEVVHSESQVVVCSHLTEVIQSNALAWVLLYPDGASLAVRGFDDHQVTVSDIELDDLIAFIDQAEQLARAS